VMLTYTPDWRWLLDRPDSPWYPTARLFRQRAVGDWQGVVDGVANALPILPSKTTPDVPVFSAFASPRIIQ
jgi:hypothetical protein